MPKELRYDSSKYCSGVRENSLLSEGSLNIIVCSCRKKRGQEQTMKEHGFFLNVYNLTVSPIRFFKAKYPDT